MANNQKQITDSAVVVTAPVGGVTEGDIVAVGGIVGVAFSTVAAGLPVTLERTGKFALSKTAALAISQGDKCYWDSTTKAVTADDSDQFVGVASDAALAADTTVDVMLHPEGATSSMGLVAENTDGNTALDFTANTPDAGTWTNSMQAAGPRLRHTAAAAEEGTFVAVPLPARSTAGKGRKITKIVANYEVNTADVDDVRFELYKRTLGADGAARVLSAALAGDVDAHYDANHDTAAKRGDSTAGPELHRAEITVPSPAYIAADEQFFVRLVVDGDAGVAGVVDITGVQVEYSETLIDLT